MKVGEYIRNKYGIAKIIDIKTNDKGIDICYFDNDIAFIFDTKLKEEKYRTHILPLANNVDINKIKHSPNIIDLIEVGDLMFLNIANKKEAFKDLVVPRIAETENELQRYLEKLNNGEFALKGILTKEQKEKGE